MPDIVYLSLRKTEEFPDQWYALAQDDHFWMQWRLQVFLQQLKDLGVNQTQVKRGLEIGCGDGALRCQLELHTSWIIDGADINDVALKRSQVKRGVTYFYDIFDRRKDLCEAYDFIILFDVLEHIVDEKAFLEAVLFHLKKGGTLFINVPALQRFHSPYDVAVGHVRRYDKEMMANVFKQVMLKSVDMRFWGFSLLPFLLIRKLCSNAKQSPAKIIRDGFKPPHPLFNTAMKGMMQVETRLMKKPVLGTSLLAVAVKEN